MSRRRVPPLTPSVHGLKYEARAMSAILSLDTDTLALVGTFSMLNDNELSVLKYEPDAHEIQCLSVYAHRPEIWCLSSCPWNAAQCFTSYDAAGKAGLTLWTIPILDEKESGNELIGIASLGSEREFPSPVHSLAWGGVGYRDRFVTACPQEVAEWSLDGGSAAITKLQPFQLTSGSQKIMGVEWDRCEEDRVLVGVETSLEWVDIRTGRSVSSISNPHEFGLRSIASSPMVPHEVVSAGDDQFLRVWDARNLNHFVAECPAHAHWITCLRYNPSFDRLLLSASTDSLIQAWDIRHPRNDDGDLCPTSDELRNIAVFDKHEDSVYACEWLAGGSWIFSSLSADGRFLVHQIPEDVKSRILKSL